jgi:alkanesulfonate monooxygenase SsuD/methylene tetrahydromethanopterin reductase-like flavin-dependent oxidoreductase (luciferase family)
VKFGYFHLMPWAYLPVDFAQKYASSWVTVPHELFDPVKSHLLFNRYMDELEYAEQVGFDDLGVNEHHMSAYAQMPSPNMVAMALARRTTRANLLIMGASIGLYDPPIRVAEEIAMLDVVSGGRVKMGFPVGISMDLNYAYGVTPAIAREKYEEALRLILKAWTAEEPFSWNGKYTQLRYVNLWTRPLQKPHPPIWTPGGNSVETWDICARHDLAYAFFSFSNWRKGVPSVEGYFETMDKAGYPFNPYRAGTSIICGVSETDALAETEYEEAGDYFFRNSLHVDPMFLEAPGFRSVKSKRYFAQRGQDRAKNWSVQSGKGWQASIKGGTVVAGSPESVAQQLTEMAKTLRVGHLMMQLQFGNMSAELTRKNATLFAQEVIPRLRNLWSEYEDHWSPKPLDIGQRAVVA